MSDRTSASIFGQTFEYLARKPEQNREHALVFWERAKHYDFHPCQMECNEALVSLGLAKWVDDEIQYK